MISTKKQDTLGYKHLPFETLTGLDLHLMENDFIVILCTAIPAPCISI